MLNPFHEVNWRPGLPERRTFAASLVVGFPCLATGLFLVQRLHGGAGTLPFALGLGAGGAALGAVLWAVPPIARPFYVVWYGAACALGFVAGNGVLAAVYLLVLAPTGLLLRAGGRRALVKTFDRRAATYWSDAPKPDGAARYYRQF